MLAVAISSSDEWTSTVTTPTPLPRFQAMLVCAQLGQKITVGGQESSGDSTGEERFHGQAAWRRLFAVTDTDDLGAQGGYHRASPGESTGLGVQDPRGALLM